MNFFEWSAPTNKVNGDFFRTFLSSIDFLFEHIHLESHKVQPHLLVRFDVGNSVVEFLDEIAGNLICMGLSFADIQKATGLPIQRIEELAKQMLTANHS